MIEYIKTFLHYHFNYLCILAGFGIYAILYLIRMKFEKEKFMKSAVSISPEHTVVWDRRFTVHRTKNGSTTRYYATQRWFVKLGNGSIGVYQKEFQVTTFSCLESYKANLS